MNSGPFFVYFGSPPLHFQPAFFLWHLGGKIPLVNGALFGCNHVQLVTWCYLMLRKSSTTGIMGYQNPTGYKVLAPQKRKTQNHSLGNIFATWKEAKQQGSKHQTHHFILTTRPSRKTHQNLSKCKIHSLPSKEKKTIQNDVWFTPLPPLPRVFVSCFFGGPVLYDKISPVILWAFASLHGCSSWRLADPTYQHANGKKTAPDDYTAQLNREYKKP